MREHLKHWAFSMQGLDRKDGMPVMSSGQQFGK